MRNHVKNTAAAAAIFAAATGAAFVGGLTPAAADPGGGQRANTEWCEDDESHNEGFDSEEHASFHDDMGTHMKGSAGMGMGMGGWEIDDMDPAASMSDSSGLRFGSSMRR